MSGFLDPKSRVLDAIITPTGRSKMLNGGLDIRFVSFTDISQLYDKDANGIYVERPAKLNTEAVSTPNDEIFQTTDDNGKIKSYATIEKTDDEYESFILEALGPNWTAKEYSSGFIEESVGLETNELNYHKLSYDYITTVQDSFKNQYIIKTVDKSKIDTGFRVEPTLLNYEIIEGRPFSTEPDISTISDADSLFADKRLSTVPNFKYLPPVQRENSLSNYINFGNYANFSEQNDIGEFTFEQNLKNLENYELKFSKYTENNDLVIQIFESKNGKNTKLDVINYGKFLLNPGEKLKDLYFVGKLYFDEFEVPTFINIFTLVI